MRGRIGEGELYFLTHWKKKHINTSIFLHIDSRWLLKTCKRSISICSMKGKCVCVRVQLVCWCSAGGRVACWLIRDHVERQDAGEHTLIVFPLKWICQCAWNIYYTHCHVIYFVLRQASGLHASSGCADTAPNVHTDTQTKHQIVKNQLNVRRGMVFFSMLC